MYQRQSYMVAAGGQDRMVTFGLLLVLGLNARGTWSAARLDCPHTGAWLQSSQKCLMVLTTDIEFGSVYDARRRCWFFGAEIAAIDGSSIDVATALLKNATQSTLSRSAYIGLNDVEVEGNWTWFDGSAIDEQILLWDNGEPNSGGGGSIKDEDCVVAMAHGTSLQLHDYPCCLASGISAVFCQMTAQQLTDSVEGGKERFPEDDDPLALECILGVNECDEAPCYNDGTCVDKLGRYECLCPIGLTGRQCEIDIDYCLDAGCLNNSTCEDLIDSFQCICQTGFVGILCETGICSRPPDADNSTQEGENVTEGSTVRYTCDFGYRFPKKFGGQPFVELVCSGHNWTFGNHSDTNNNQSLDLLHCEPVFCLPFHPWNGIEKLESTGSRVGDVVTYKCDNEGKKFFIDEKPSDIANLTTTCHPDGIWIPLFQSCKHVETGKKEKIEPVEAPGAAAIGTIAIVFISIEVALIVLMDIDHLIRHARMFKDNVAVGFNRLTS